MAKRLYRSRRERILGGVCGGVAEYLDVDPALVRTVWVLVSLAGGAGILAYIVGLILIPEAPAEEWPRPSAAREALPQEPGVARGEGGGGGVGVGGEAGGAGGAGRAGRPGRSTSASFVLGVALLVVGATLLVNNVFPGLRLIVGWPLVLVLLGVWFLIEGLRGGPR